jgi:hypothetical protein
MDRKIAFNEQVNKLLHDLIPKDSAWERFSRLWRDLWDDLMDIQPIFTKLYRLLVDSLDKVMDSLDKSSLVKRKLERSNQLVALIDMIDVSPFPEPFKAMHESIRHRLATFRQELPQRLTKEVLDGGRAMFSSLKLSDVPMSISERITELFTHLAELQATIQDDRIDALLDAYEQNAACRMASCKRAAGNLQRLNVAVEPTLDPKLLAIRLEAEVAFLNKYLQNTFPAYQRRLKLLLS